MDYRETIEWLYTQLPVFQRQGKAAYKANLNNSIVLDQALGNPHKSFPTIHIAGTNGKGSTAHYIASILQESGYKVGLHTSPHYFDFRERIKINGLMVDERYVVDFIEKYKKLELNIIPSFFELTVLMAFSYFKEEKVDVAIIETGMGGRLDTTNIISPIVSIITNIGIDHSQFLGDTISKIALEKAGIIKKGIPIVLGEMDIAALEIMYAVAQEKSASVHISSPYVLDKKIPNYQKENISTAVSSIRIIQDSGWNISDEDIKKGLENVASNTYFIGRWQQLQESPIVILDSAHNVDGILSMLDSLSSYEYDRLRIVFGMVDDKDSSTILSLLPSEAIYYFTEADIPRAKDAIKLQSEATEHSLNGEVYPKVIDAYNKAVSQAKDSDLILVVGSIFIVGEVLRELE